MLFGEPLMGGQPKRILVNLGHGEQAGNAIKVNYAYMARPSTQGFFTLSLDGKELVKDPISLSEDHTSRDLPRVAWGVGTQRSPCRPLVGWLYSNR